MLTPNIIIVTITRRDAAGRPLKSFCLLLLLLLRPSFPRFPGGTGFYAVKVESKKVPPCRDAPFSATDFFPVSFGKFRVFVFSARAGASGAPETNGPRYGNNNGSKMGVRSPISELTPEHVAACAATWAVDFHFAELPTPQIRRDIHCFALKSSVAPTYGSEQEIGAQKGGFSGPVDLRVTGIARVQCISTYQV
jgi:hypothetical protein